MADFSTHTQQKLKMILNDKNDCIESITRALEGSSAWRKAISVGFPDDPRNMRASETLDELAADADNLTDEHWRVLRPYFGGWASETWRSGLSKTARQVGFYHRAKNFDVFVKALAHNLSSLSVAA